MVLTTAESAWGFDVIQTLAVPDLVEGCANMSKTRGAWDSKFKMYKLTAAANISSKKVSQVAPNAMFTPLMSRVGN